MDAEEVMIAQSQGIGQKITQVAILLETKKEATITAINLAIPSAINLVEIIKHKVKGLHQINNFERVPNTTKTRLIIKLSLNPLDSSAKGYQSPIPYDQVTEKSLDELKKSPKKEEDTRSPAEERRGRRRPYRNARFDRGRRNAPRRGGDYNRGRGNSDYGRPRRSNRGSRGFRDRNFSRRRGSRANNREGGSNIREEAKTSGQKDPQNPPNMIKDQDYWGEF